MKQKSSKHLLLFLSAQIITVVISRLWIIYTGIEINRVLGLHIAHSNWGVLIFLVTTVLVLTSFIKDQTVAILYGIAYGFIIDEVGKFITGNNEEGYYHPYAVPIILINFVILAIVNIAVFLKEKGRNGN